VLRTKTHICALHKICRLLRKTARKLEEAQKQLKRCTEDGKPGIKTPLASPNGLPANRMTTATLPVLSHHQCAPTGAYPMNHGRFHSPTDARHLKVMFQNLKLKDGAVEDKDKQFPHADAKCVEEPRRNSNSSCETMTSSSECESGSDDESDEADTVILGNYKKREGKKRDSPQSAKNNKSKLEDVGELTTVFDPSGSGKPSSRGGSGVLYRSGAFTHHSVGAEDKPINSDEWIYFLMTTMKVRNSISDC